MLASISGLEGKLGAHPCCLPGTASVPQMCLALRHLHSHNVVHLDVKPDNIYTWGEFDGEHEMPTVYKLGDFGQATRFDCQQALIVHEGDCRWVTRG
jgi:hypothetical protein